MYAAHEGGSWSIAQGPRSGSRSVFPNRLRVSVTCVVLMVHVAHFIGTAESSRVRLKNLQSLSSPLNVLHPTYHSDSAFLKLRGAGARATQYGCAILHAGAIDELNSCLSVAGIAWLRAVSCAHRSTYTTLQFPCFRTIEKERVIWAKDKADFRHRIACSPNCLRRKSYRGEMKARSARVVHQPPKQPRGWLGGARRPMAVSWKHKPIGSGRACLCRVNVMRLVSTGFRPRSSEKDRDIK